MRLEHVALWVADVERVARFYEDYFSAVAGEPYSNEETGFHSRFLTFDSGARLEIMRRPGVRARSQEMGEISGYAHLAVAVGSE